MLAGRIGWRSESILEEIKGLDLEIRRRIHLPGFVEDNDKSALISGATAVLYPSLYEGFGFPVLEAQACRTPVLAANSSSLPEIAGEAAVFVDPKNLENMVEGMVNIVANDELRNNLMEQGSQNIKRFSWEKTATNVLQTLTRAASGS